MVQLILDVREKRLAEALTTLGVTFTTAALDVGDFLIQSDDGDPLLVAERKSHADFAASNTDGRYREQRARLMAVRGSGVAVLYILEGAWSSPAGEEVQVYGSTTEINLKRLTTRLILRYGMPVLFSDTLLGTARWCRLLLTQLADDVSVFHPESAEAMVTAMSGFTAALSTVKKANKTAGGTAHGMLSAVPGLGAKRIEALLAEKKIADLVTMSVAEIADVVAGGKRLGPKVAATLHEAFHSRNL